MCLRPDPRSRLAEPRRPSPSQPRVSPANTPFPLPRARRGHGASHTPAAPPTLGLLLHLPPRPFPPTSRSPPQRRHARQGTSQRPPPSPAVPSTLLPSTPTSYIHVTNVRNSLLAPGSGRRLERRLSKRLWSARARRSAEADGLKRRPASQGKSTTSSWPQPPRFTVPAAPPREDARRPSSSTKATYPTAATRCRPRGETA